MNPEDVARILDDLGERLGPSGEYVFGLAVRQQLILGVLGAALCVAVIIATVYSIRRLSKDAEDRMFGAVVGGGIAAVFAFLAIPVLLNPEYAALVDLLSRIVP